MPKNRGRSFRSTRTIIITLNIRFIKTQSPTTAFGFHTHKQTASSTAQITTVTTYTPIKQHLENHSKIMCCRKKSCITRYTSHKCSSLIMNIALQRTATQEINLRTRGNFLFRETFQRIVCSMLQSHRFKENTVQIYIHRYFRNSLNNLFQQHKVQATIPI